MRYLLLLLMLLPLGVAAQNDSLPYIRPPYLKKGDTVALVAPSRKLSKKKDTTNVRRRLESWGLHVKYGSHCLDTSHPYFCGSDTERADDIRRAIADPTVRAVIAYQGGYGSVRTLPYLDLGPLRQDPKWLVGFSDITMLHLALRHQRVESIHGPMPGSFVFEEGKCDESAESLRRALFGLTDSICVAPHPLNVKGVAEGRLAGGNLALVCSAIATPEEVDPRIPTVLLIEDIGESAYRLDRMMQQMLRSGLLSQVKAVLVGHFTDITRVRDFETDSILKVLAQYTTPLGIPVVYGFPAGHEAPNLALYMGREVRVEVSDGGATLTFL